MAQSYIPAGTDVICTEMMSGMPAQLGLTRDAKVLYGEERKPLLNICDKKLSCSLQCRIKQTFFAGLTGLLAGLTIGAIALVFVIGTGGAGGLVIAAAVAAAAALGAGTIGACITATVYKYLANECDCSLSGKWEMYHRTARLEGYNALLERSILTCSKGGIVSLVMSHDKAVQLAKMISDTNNKIEDVHMFSKLAQGTVSSLGNAFKASGGGDVVGLVIGSGFAIYDYMTGGNDCGSDKNMQAEQEYAHKSIKGEHADLKADGGLWTEESTRDTGINVFITTWDTSIPIIGTNGKIIGTLVRWGSEELKEGNEITRAFWRHFTGKTIKDIGNTFSRDFFNKVNAQKFGVNIVASLVANGIEWGTNEYENNLYKEMIDAINDLRTDKGIKGINLMAQSL